MPVDGCRPNFYYDMNSEVVIHYLGGEVIHLIFLSLSSIIIQSPTAALSRQYTWKKHHNESEKTNKTLDPEKIAEA